MADFRDSLAYQLVQLGRASDAAFARRLERLGVRPSHVRLMTAIQNSEHLSQNDLADELHVTPGFIVGLADELEQRGAVVRRRVPGDRRRQILVLTETGEALLQDATHAAIALDRQLAHALSRQDVGELRRLAQTVQVSLDEAKPDASPVAARSSTR